MALGVSKSEIYDSTFTDLKVYEYAEKLRIKRRDEDNYAMGIYFMRALSVVVNFSGKPIEYFKKPLLQQIEEENRELTADEQLNKQKALFAMLSTMQANFELSKGKE